MREVKLSHVQWSPRILGKNRHRQSLLNTNFSGLHDVRPRSQSGSRTQCLLPILRLFGRYSVPLEELFVVVDLSHELPMEILDSLNWSE